MSTGTLSNRPDRPEMTRRTIEPAQQTAARVVGFTFLFAMAIVVSTQSRLANSSTSPIEMRRGRALIRKPAIPRARGWCWWGGCGGVLHQLVGEEQFRQIIRTFLSEFKDKPADFKDFQQVAERVSRRDLGKHFNEWIYGAESSQLLLDKVPITEIIKRY